MRETKEYHIFTDAISADLSKNNIFLCDFQEKENNIFIEHIKKNIENKKDKFIIHDPDNTIFNRVSSINNIKILTLGINNNDFHFDPIYQFNVNTSVLAKRYLAELFYDYSGASGLITKLKYHEELKHESEKTMRLTIVNFLIDAITYVVENTTTPDIRYLISILKISDNSVINNTKQKLFMKNNYYNELSEFARSLCYIILDSLSQVLTLNFVPENKMVNNIHLTDLIKEYDIVFVNEELNFNCITKEYELHSSKDENESIKIEYDIDLKKTLFIDALYHQLYYLDMYSKSFLQLDDLALNITSQYNINLFFNKRFSHFSSLKLEQMLDIPSNIIFLISY